MWNSVWIEQRLSDPITTCSLLTTSSPSKPHPTSPPEQPIPGLQHQPLRAVLAELAEFIVLEHAEGFAGVVGAHQVGWVEDVAQFVSAEAVEVGVIGIEFGSEQSSAFGIEGEGWSVVSEVLCPASQREAGIGELKGSRYGKASIDFMR
jgi:hypothetical protein